MKTYPLYTDRRAPVEKVDGRDIKAPITLCSQCCVPHARVMSAELSVDHASTKNPVGGILVFGDTPSQQEARSGRPFSAGDKHIVRHIIEELTDKPVVYDFVVKCPPKFKNGARVPPKDATRSHHLGYAKTLIDEMKPSRIFCFGYESYKSILGSKTQPVDCRRGYGYLSCGTPVFIFPGPKEFSTNHFILDRVRADIEWALEETPEKPPWDAVVNVVETVDDARKVVSLLKTKKWSAIDTETVGMRGDPDFFRVECLAVVANDSDDSYVWCPTALKKPEVVRPLKCYLTDEKCLKGGHNYKFDLQVMAHHFGLIDDNWNIQIKGFYGDSQLWAKQLETEAACNLANASEMVGMGGLKYENDAALKGAVTKINEARAFAEETGYRQNPIPGMYSDILEHAVNNPDRSPKTYAYGLVPYETMVRYCALDTVASAKLMRLLKPRIEANVHTSFVWTNILEPATEALAQVELWGLPCSKRKLRAFTKLTKKKADQALKKLRSLGCTVDINSAPALEGYLYDTLGLPVVKKTAKGARSTDAETLKKLLEKTGNAVLQAILDYREAYKLYSTYGIGLESLVRGSGRINGSLKLDGTRTGRLSSEEPNFQNLPSGGDFAKLMKGTFQAREGYSIIQLDYSQLEYRIIAALSGDPVMYKAYLEGADLHMRTAQAISKLAWGIEPEEVTSDHRRLAKNFSFGLLYGMTDGTLAKNLGISKQEATLIRSALMASWKEVDKWIKEQKAFTNKYGCTFTYWPDGKGGWLKSRKRDLFDIASEDVGAMITATNGSYNSSVQGSASDFMLKSVCKVVKWFVESAIPGRVINTVHDSIILEVRDDYVTEVIEFVTAVMEHWDCAGMPLVADAEVGPTWGGLLDYKKVLLTAKMKKEGYSAQEMAKVLGLEGKEGVRPEELITPYEAISTKIAA